MADNINADHASIVRGIEHCLPNLKQGLEQALQNDNAVFFMSIVLGDEVHALPVMAPINIANMVATEIFKIDRLETDEMGELLKSILMAMRMNSVTPAPQETHIGFLGMYETLIHSGMHEHEEIVRGLADLTPGDLVVIQIILYPEETAISTGMRVVKNPLQVYEHEASGEGVVLPELANKNDVGRFDNYVFPSHMTKH